MSTRLASLAVLLVIAAPCARALDAVVVKSSGIRLYDTAIAGFQKEFKGSLEVLGLKRPGLIETIRKKQPRVIIAVGLSATRALTAAFSRIPIVFCMTMHQEKHGLKTANTTGVALGPRPGDQLEAFRRVMPGLKRVGLIYDPKVSGDFVSRAEPAAREQGLGLITRPVSRREEVLGALRAVARSADAVWLIRDQTVMSREFFNYALIVQAEKKVPLLVFSPVFVQKGALASYSSGYREQGRLAAWMAMEILSGADPVGIPVRYPQGTLYLNRRAAQVTRHAFPAGLLEQPDVRVFD